MTECLAETQAIITKSSPEDNNGEQCKQICSHQRFILRYILNNEIYDRE